MHGKNHLGIGETRLSSQRPSNMPDITRNNFGLVIAYVIPGFVALWGAGSVSPIVRSWLQPMPNLPASLESVFFVTLASVAAGMTASAIRFATIDQIHHWTGLRRPVWDDRRLQRNLQAFDAVVEDHYRFYQFHANSAVSLAFVFLTWWFTTTLHPVFLTLGFIGIEAILLATSRDNLAKYYVRASQVLGRSMSPSRRKEVKHVQR